jgi:hypothetical protein
MVAIRQIGLVALANLSNDLLKLSLQSSNSCSRIRLLAFPARSLLLENAFGTRPQTFLTDFAFLAWQTSHLERAARFASPLRLWEPLR